MAFRQIPAKVSYGDQAITDYYEGVGVETGLYLFQVRDGNRDVYVMTTQFLDFELTDGGSTGLPRFVRTGEYGGKACFAGLQDWLIYYLPSRQKWILTQAAPAVGYIPSTAATASYNESTGNIVYTYAGDIWWEADPSSVNTMPYDGAEFGTFTFPLSGYVSQFPSLAPYASTTYRIVGDVAGAKYKLSSGDGPYGLYGNNMFVGIPEWSYTADDLVWISQYPANEYVNLEEYSIRQVEGIQVPLWQGLVATALGAPNADTTRGWYATTDKPPAQDWPLKWYHFVPTYPETPELGGVVRHDEGWEDEGGEFHPMPDITVTWAGVKSLDDAHISVARGKDRVYMAEAAIWR